MKKILLFILVPVFSFSQDFSKTEVSKNIQTINNILTVYVNDIEIIKEYFDNFESTIFNTSFQGLQEENFSSNPNFFDNYEKLYINKVKYNKRLKESIESNNLQKCYEYLKKIKHNLILIKLCNEIEREDYIIRKFDVIEGGFNLSIYVPLSDPERLASINYQYQQNFSGNKITLSNKKFYEIEFISDDFELQKIIQYKLKLINKVAGGSHQSTTLQPTGTIRNGEFQYGTHTSYMTLYDYTYEFYKSSQVKLINGKVHEIIQDNEKLLLKDERPTRYTSSDLDFKFNHEGFIFGEYNNRFINSKLDGNTIIFDKKKLYNIKNNLLNDQLKFTRYSFVKNPKEIKQFLKNRDIWYKKYLITYCENEPIYGLNKFESSVLKYEYIINEVYNFNIDKPSTYTAHLKKEDWVNPLLQGVNLSKGNFFDYYNCENDDINPFDEYIGNFDLENYNHYVNMPDYGSEYKQHYNISDIFNLLKKGLELEDLGESPNNNYTPNQSGIYYSFFDKEILFNKNYTLIKFDNLLINLNKENFSDSKFYYFILNNWEDTYTNIIKLKKDIYEYTYSLMGYDEQKIEKKLEVEIDSFLNNYSEGGHNKNIFDIYLKKPKFYGCKDSLYLEYDETSNGHKQSLCKRLIIKGCMDSLYKEYNPEANLDNNTCKTYTEVYKQFLKRDLKLNIQYKSFNNNLTKTLTIPTNDLFNYPSEKKDKANAIIKWLNQILDNNYNSFYSINKEPTIFQVFSDKISMKCLSYAFTYESKEEIFNAYDYALNKRKLISESELDELTVSYLKATNIEVFCHSLSTNQFNFSDINNNGEVITINSVRFSLEDLYYSYLLKNINIFFKKEIKKIEKKLSKGKDIPEKLYSIYLLRKKIEEYKSTLKPSDVLIEKIH